MDKTTSASPRRAVSSARLVLWARTFTSMPVFSLKIGSRYPNRPESCVDIVEATRISSAVLGRPRPMRAIGHSEVSGGRQNRPFGPNCFKQSYLAGADAVGKIQT